MGKIRKGRSERHDVSSISQAWIDAHQHHLTPRDVEMMRLLTIFPVMTVRHLTTLTPVAYLPSGKAMQPFYESRRGEQLCRDRVRKLYDLHFINKYAPRLGMGEGTSPQYIWLDRAGYRYFEIEGRPPKTLSVEYAHHMYILDVYCMLMELERQGRIRIDYLEVCYTCKPTTANIEPDLIVCFQKDKKGYKYFIEVDTGTKKEKEELRKLERYKDWELSFAWIKEEWADCYKKRFPYVIYLLFHATSRRRTVLQTKAQDLDLRSKVITWTEWKESFGS